MVKNIIPFHKGLSLRGFQEQYGTKAKCERFNEKIKRPNSYKFVATHLIALSKTGT